MRPSNAGHVGGSGTSRMSALTQGQGAAFERAVLTQATASISAGPRPTTAQGRAALRQPVAAGPLGVVSMGNRTTREGQGRAEVRSGLCGGIQWSASARNATTPGENRNATESGGGGHNSNTTWEVAAPTAAVSRALNAAFAAQGPPQHRSRRVHPVPPNLPGPKMHHPPRHRKPDGE